TSGVGALLRIFWMFFGFAVLGLVAAVTAYRTPGEPSWRDVLFWAVVAALVAARWIDVERYDGRTADGEPASFADVRTYAVKVGVLALALWGAAHGMACAAG